MNFLRGGIKKRKDGSERRQYTPVHDFKSSQYEKSEKMMYMDLEHLENFERFWLETYCGNFFDQIADSKPDGDTHKLLIKRCNDYGYWSFGEEKKHGNRLEGSGMNIE